MASPQEAPKESGSQEVIRTPFGNFVVGGRIGRGAFAQVYKAWWGEAGFFVAIKAFDTSAMSQETVDSVLNEVVLLGKMKHPHILRVLGYHRADPNLYLMLEFAENGSLLKIIKDHGALSEKNAAVFTRQVLQALVYLHARGVIHRDLKAANILLNRRGDVKLADFGVAAVMGNTDKHFTIVGSPYWMAPEIIQAAGHSTLSDIWSLGCTVVELLTGEPPFFGLNPMTAMFKIVQSPAPIPSSFSPLMHDFLEKCFRKDPDRRPPASELLKDPLFQQPDIPESVDIASIMKKSARSNSIEPVVPTHPVPSPPPPEPQPVVKSPSPSEADGSSPAKAKRSIAARRKYREKRDSRMAIPAYQVEREVGETTAETAADEIEDNLSDSESSSTLSSSGSLRGRVSLDESRRTQSIRHQRSSKSQFATMGRLSSSKGLAEINITIDPSLASSGGLASSKKTGDLHSKIPASARFKTLPKGGLQELAKDEAMQLEIESLKQRLMKAQGEEKDSEDGSLEASTEIDGGRVLSTRASMLEELIPSNSPLPPQIESVCSMYIINDILWIGGMTGTIAAYSLPKFQLLSCTSLHKTRIYSIIRVGSTRIFASSEDGGVYVFPPKDPSRAKHHRVHDVEHPSIKCLLFLDGERPRVWSCAPCRTNTQIKVMNKKCEIKYKLEIKASLCCATISPTMESCWFGCSNSSIIVCDIVDGEFRRDFQVPCKDPSRTTVRAMLSVGDLVWCAAGSNIYIYDPFNFTVEKTLSISSSTGIESLALFESAVLVGTSSGTVECFDSISMAHLMTLPLSGITPSTSSAPVSALAAVPGSLLTGRTGVPALFAIPSSSNALSLWSTPPASSR